MICFYGFSAEVSLGPGSSWGAPWAVLRGHFFPNADRGAPTNVVHLHPDGLLADLCALQERPHLCTDV